MLTKFSDGRHARVSWRITNCSALSVHCIPARWQMSLAKIILWNEDIVRCRWWCIAYDLPLEAGPSSHGSWVSAESEGSVWFWGSRELPCPRHGQSLCCSSFRRMPARWFCLWGAVSPGFQMRSFSARPAKQWQTWKHTWPAVQWFAALHHTLKCTDSHEQICREQLVGLKSGVVCWQAIFLLSSSKSCCRRYWQGRLSASMFPRGMSQAWNMPLIPWLS